MYQITNAKTKEESGLDYVISALTLYTPFGEALKKNAKIFLPGEEELLRGELNKVQTVLELMQSNQELVEEIENALVHVKDVTASIDRSKTEVLTTVELFEIKALLLAMEWLGKALDKSKRIDTSEDLVEFFILKPTKDLLDALDPRNDRMATFYLYEEYSENLTVLRKKKREIELAIRRLEKEKNDNNRDNIEEQISVKNEELQNIIIEIEDEEEIIRIKLSAETWKYSNELLLNCETIGDLDYTWAKANFARKTSSVRPEILGNKLEGDTKEHDNEEYSDVHRIAIEEGRHPQIEATLKKAEKVFTPISLRASKGVTCITGANMGGKTVVLRLISLFALMGQMGFFLPAKSAKIGLSDYIRILVGDSQSVDRGLSSFGGEIEELKEIIDKVEQPIELPRKVEENLENIASYDNTSKNQETIFVSKENRRPLILIDEIASGTNPVEGSALTKALIEYLAKR
ncbi:MAG: MutS-related protein, partial [Anaerovoracaceae bacterium]